MSLFRKVPDKTSIACRHFDNSGKASENIRIYRGYQNHLDSHILLSKSLGFGAVFPSLRHSRNEPPGLNTDVNALLTRGGLFEARLRLIHR